MSDIISFFNGIDPVPRGETDWMTVLKNIQSDKYREAVEAGRLLVGDPVQYREYKKRFPSVTFGGCFTKRRNAHNILSATGFLPIDIDHVGDVERLFSSLSQDEHIWFIFRSPSGDGLKCAVRAEGIKTDDDIKKLYSATERYLSETYNLKIDPTSKDICRLTFISWDPQLFINPNPFYFDIEKWLKKPEQQFYAPPEQNNGWKSKYGQKVLDSCCLEISQSAAGNQHNTRLRMSRLVGGYIASGFIDEAMALQSLESAVKASGAKLVHQAMDTVQDGIAYGKQKPLQPEERIGSGKKDDIQYYCDPDGVFLNESEHVSDVSDVSDVDIVSDVQPLSAGCQQDVSRMSAGEVSRYPAGPYNLAGSIKEWIENSTGSFTVEQLDREFCLTSRTEKNNRSKVLARACACMLIKKNKNIIGKYEIIDHSLNTVDLKNVSIDPFEIKLPFDLNRYCLTPKKAIIIIAGSSNAGKTGIILNIAKLNLSQQYKKMYLASEMAGGEILSRLTKFKDVPLDDWCEHLHIAERSHDFQSVVEAHNKDGLTLIDYLEEIDGEYNKITSQIRGVYDALNTGVAVIGIQKRTDSDIARGGQGTLEKSRMYVAIDSICVVDNQPICAIKIIKLKSWINRNLNYHELHFRLKHGAVIEPISDWMVLKPGERERYKVIYESQNPERKKEQMDEWAFQFKTKSGTLVGINEETFGNWQKTYSNLDLYEILEELSNATYKKSWLNDKGWVFQLTGLLAKKNEGVSK